ncbi:hypothetical protein [Vibrio harveyi]|uniref:hypothetical protein n=1 Tax=Vibrio harveyi TaxID=669 RepID=UPI0006833A5A|nr:hypothetical protein [Vibrio harveyi]
MVIDIPSKKDFHEMGESLIQSAWESLVHLLKEYDEYAGFDEGGDFEFRYFKYSKPKIMSAFTLVQQAVEFFLKGNIAGVSPYILIANDGKNWPKKADKSDISFLEFRTLDAQDLIKIHNTFCSDRLDESFTTWFNQMRSVRNQVMHSVNEKSTISPLDLAKEILTAHEYFFGKQQWIKARFDYHAKQPSNDLNIVGELESEGYRYFEIHEELSIVISSLKPSLVKQFFGFNPKSRSIECYFCEDWFRKIYFYEDAHWKRHNIDTMIQSSADKSHYECFVCGTSLDVLVASCVECRQVKLDKNTSRCVWCEE